VTQKLYEIGAGTSEIRRMLIGGNCSTNRRRLRSNPNGSDTTDILAWQFIPIHTFGGANP